MQNEGYAAADIDDFLAGKVAFLPLPGESGAAAAPVNPLAGLGSVQLKSSSASNPASAPPKPRQMSLLDELQAGRQLKAVQTDDPRMKSSSGGGGGRESGGLSAPGGLLGMLAVEMSKRRFNMKVEQEDSDSDDSGFSDDSDD